MNRIASRFSLILTAAFVVVSISVGVAGAAKPKEGSYSYSEKPPGAAGPIQGVDFTVRGDRAKIKNFSYFNGFTCGPPLEVKKALTVKGSGKFSYSGKAASTVPGQGKFAVDIDGKFVSKKSAEGTLVSKCPSESDLTLEFKAKLKGKN